MTTYNCGCQIEVHEPSGVLHCVSKCARHKAKQRAVSTLDQAYYEELGSLVNGDVRTDNYMAELTEALGTFPLAKPREDGLLSVAYEIGGGVSPYCKAILDADYFYLGVEPSIWACHYMCNRYHLRMEGDLDSSKQVRGLMLHGCIDDWQFGPDASLVLAAHSLEHMEDAPGAIRQCSDMLVPGGELWIIVPDDSDPCNPDHLWFFTEASLRSCVERAGLTVERFAVRKYVPHERFLYCRARKPA